MIAIVDVDYREDHAVAACVLAREWTDSETCGEWTVKIVDVEPYSPGEFFRRELPCLLAVLRKVAEPAFIVIDGYVWLGPKQFGLGAHLHDELNQIPAVIGVAKTRFHSADVVAVPLQRGTSKTPLWITSAGIDAHAAAEAVRSMHGEHRIPTLIKRADRLSRESAGF